MFEYVVALLAVALLAYFLKVRVNVRPLAYAFLIFVGSMFVWGAIADYFNIKPTDLLTTILYSLVGFTVFWIIWLKWRKEVG